MSLWKETLIVYIHIYIRKFIFTDGFSIILAKRRQNCMQKIMFYSHTILVDIYLYHDREGKSFQIFQHSRNILTYMKWYISFWYIYIYIKKKNT